MGLGRQRSVGIRLTEQGARFVELESGLGRVRMLGTGVLDLEPAGQSGSTTPSTEATPSGGGMRRFAGADQVILGLPRRDVVCRFIDVPNVGEDKLDGLLAFEIERHLPFPLEEVCYSYRTVSSTGSMARLLIVAAKRTVVEEALARVERLGITPTAVDVSSLAAATAFQYQQAIPAGQTVTLVQVEADEAAVEVFSSEAVVSSRTVPLDDRGRMRSEGVTIEKKSNTKIASSGAVACPDDRAPVDGATCPGPLVAELKRVGAIINGSAGPTLLHGGDDDLGRSLDNELGTRVNRWDASALGADPATFGLALRGLPRYAVSSNLLPPERRPVRKDTAVRLFWNLALLLGCLSAGWWVSDALLERRVHAQLEEKIQQVSQAAAAVKALQREASAMSERLKALETLASTQGRSMQLLREVVTLLPADVALQELSFDGTKVRLRGSTTASAALLISAFEQSAWLENAAFTAPISMQGNDRQVFEIAATLRAVPRPPMEQREGGIS